MPGVREFSQAEGGTEQSVPPSALLSPHISIAATGAREPASVPAALDAVRNLPGMLEMTTTRHAKAGDSIEPPALQKFSL